MRGKAIFKRVFYFILAAVFSAGALAVPVSEAGNGRLQNNKEETYTFALKDGKSLKADNNGWILMPEGEDTIVIGAGPDCTVRNKYAPEKVYEKDKGSINTYTFNINDIKLEGEEFSIFLKYFNDKLKSDIAFPDSSKSMRRYVTNAYSSLEIGRGDNYTDVNISWHAELPELESLYATGEVFCTPFNLSDYEQRLVMSKDTRKSEITFTAGVNAKKIYLRDVDNNIIENALTKKGDTYSFKVNEEDFREEDILKLDLVLESENGNRQTVRFIIERRVKGIDSPDKVIDYLCIGSSGSNVGNPLGVGIASGLYPEKSLSGVCESPINLGSFGGYVIYYYEKAIKDDPKNPYGVDFIVYGDSTRGEGYSPNPGNVLVSKNGMDWYTLAGSEHYENRTRWGHKVVYEKTASGRTIIDGREGISELYPCKDNYPLHDWPQGEEKFTAEGVTIGDGVSLCYPAFGYADVRINTPESWSTGKKWDISGRAKNPYLEVPHRFQYEAPEETEALYEGAGDCFDLAWAVDKDGLPAGLSKIHYIKIQTASTPNAMVISGEQPTDVNAVARAVPSDSQVGISSPPDKITVGGNELELMDGTYIYSWDGDGIFDVEVEASPEANVYINNFRGRKRTFVSSPNKNYIRVIVQEGEKAPLIYYIHVNYAPLFRDDVAEALGGSSSGNAGISRGSAIWALYKLSGEPGAAAGKSPARAGGYEDAALWAADMGIIRGDGTGLALGREITREELSRILYSYGDIIGVGFSDIYGIAEPGRPEGTDFPPIPSSWAFFSMKWALGTGIMHDIPVKESGFRDYSGIVTNAEAEEILYRFFSGE